MISGLYWDYIGIMEKKTEAIILYRVIQGLYLVYEGEIGRMDNKKESAT